MNPKIRVAFWKIESMCLRWLKLSKEGNIIPKSLTVSTFSITWDSFPTPKLITFFPPDDFIESAENYGAK